MDRTPDIAESPSENGTCASTGCHTGTADDPANKGKVTLNFPGGLTYAPGVTQHLSVTISDPATTQTAWGFQLTPRLASDSTTVAGTMVPTDPNTLLMCSDPQFRIFETTCMTGGDTGTSAKCSLHQTVPACPATLAKVSLPLQYIEHSYTGYRNTQGPGSGTYSFDWTPPATNLGNITFYVAANAGPGGAATQDNAHIYTARYTLTPAATGPPTITTARSAAGFGGGFTSVAPGTWMEILGSNLAPDTRQWLSSDFNGNAAPTSLDGASVSIGGQPAFVYYISSTQINAQVPSNVANGPQQLTVTYGTTSAPYTITVNPTQPGLLAPTSGFLINGKQYVVAQFCAAGKTCVVGTDLTFALPAGSLAGSGYLAAPVSPGQLLTIYGIGFGPAMDPSNALIPAGQIAPPSSQLVNPVTMQVGGVPANISYQGLAPGQIGVYQFNLNVPAVPSGDQPLTFTQNGVKSTQVMYLAVQ